MAVIYKATNKVNGKAYIGYATNLENRISVHKYRCKNKKHEYFHNALIKHGFDNFEWSILLENATLDDERILIESHNTFWESGQGYNLTKGGEGKLGYIVSEETRQKISEANKRRVVLPTQLEILRNNAKKMIGTHRSNEVKEKISKAQSGKTLTIEHKANISKNHAAHKETGKYYQTSEYREKMSNSLKGKKRTPEQIENIRLGALKRWNKQ